MEKRDAATGGAKRAPGLSLGTTRSSPPGAKRGSSPQPLSGRERATREPLPLEPQHTASVGRRNYWRRDATTLIIIARITAPNRKASKAWVRTVRRIRRIWMSVSETWKVIPTVNAT